MKFKDWIQIDEINKGLKNHFRRQFPHVPQGVAKDVFHQRLGNMWRQESPFKNSDSYGAMSGMMDSGPMSYSDPMADTLAHDSDPSGSNGDMLKYQSIKQMYQDPKIKEITEADWGDGKPKVITITPLSFHDDNLIRFKYARFGLKSKGEVDAERHATQNELMKQRGENNQPIIVLSLGNNKFKLVEGYHRTMAYLRSGAPREDWMVLRSKQPLDKIDLSKWQPVKINAYIGVPKNSTLQQPAA